MFKPRRFLPLLSVVAFLAFSGSASAAQFVNPAPINIPDSGAASPSPATINVTGQQGPLTSVQVALLNIGHTNPEDLDILLVSPNGTASVVMSDSCGNGDVEDHLWSFPSNPPAGVSFMPIQCPGTNYKATDVNFGLPPDSWPAAHPGPHTANLSTFQGEDPNGVWSLYVIDDTPGNSGDLETGWALTIGTADSDVEIPASGTSGPANPYPATQTVTGQTGVVADVNVLIPGISHKRLDDIDALLVGPRGQKVMLMSDACGDSKLTYGAGWIIDDESLAIDFPDGAGCTFTGRFKPTDYEPGESLAAPAPPGPYAGTMAAFAGTDPNGDWQLYIEDDTAGETGWIEAGTASNTPFEVQLRTRQPAPVQFANATLGLTEGQTGSVKITRSATSALGAGSVRVTSTPGSAASGSDFTPVATTIEFAAGETEKTVPVSALTDGTAEPAETFALTLDTPAGDAATGTPSRVDVTIAASAGPAGGGGQPGPGGEPGPGGPGTGDPGSDRTAPSIGRVRVTPRKFAPVRGKARRARRRATIRYTLSEAANVTMKVQRRVGRRWRRATKLKQAGRAGANRKAFSGRVRRRVLRPGRYRLVVVAVDAAGNRATAKPRRFRIVKR